MAARRRSFIAYQALPEIGDLMSDTVIDYMDIPDAHGLAPPPVPVVQPRLVSPPHPPSSAPVVLVIVIVVIVVVVVVGGGNNIFIVIQPHKFLNILSLVSTTLWRLTSPEWQKKSTNNGGRCGEGLDG
ncbi:hypothetical protein F5H01DRAFT_326175 [Linnemannia elongata]|nr:hypothetical protein F5H01DRAFT_326175 [Linnemannia elongata]